MYLSLSPGLCQEEEKGIRENSPFSSSRLRATTPSQSLRPLRPLSLSHLSFPFGIANRELVPELGPPSTSPCGLTSYATALELPGHKSSHLEDVDGWLVVGSSRRRKHVNGHRSFSLVKYQIVAPQFRSSGLIPQVWEHIPRDQHRAYGAPVTRLSGLCLGLHADIFHCAFALFRLDPDLIQFFQHIRLQFRLPVWIYPSSTWSVFSSGASFIALHLSP